MMDRSNLPRLDSSVLIGKDNLPSIHDSLVSKVLFLTVNPESINFTRQEYDIDIVIEKFQKSLLGENLNEIKKMVEIKLIALNATSSPSNDLLIMESNYSDEENKLTQNEEDILVFNGVFKMVAIPVPDALKTSFKAITRAKKIFIRDKQDDLNFHSFFIPTEKKILCEICDGLTAQDVLRLYELIRSEKNDESNELLKKVAGINLSLKTLERKVGFKDAAFYFLIVNMMKENILNRLHTHVLENYFQHVIKSYETELLKEEVIRLESLLSKLKHYPVITSHHPGICIIFCMVEGRKGALEDLDAVERLFGKKMNYDVIVKKDSTLQDIQSIITDLRAPRNKFYDNLVVWFMGYGTIETLQVKNGEQIHRKRDFIEPFTEIEWLNKKPKLIFIQACLVKVEKPAISKRRQSSAMETEVGALSLSGTEGQEWAHIYCEHMDVSLVNNSADTLISYATKWYQSASRSENGSLYLGTLVIRLKKFGQIESIEHVMRRVHYNVNTVALCHKNEDYIKQAPYMESSLQKEFVFIHKYISDTICRIRTPRKKADKHKIGY